MAGTQRTNKVKINNGYLAYNQLGKGIPILFIHGYPLSRRIWELQEPGLSDIASIIAIDLRGHGKSFPFDPPYTMESLADDCRHLLESIEIKSPIVVCGLSMGGYVAFALYHKYPQLFRGMILTSTRAAADSPQGKANRESAIKDVRDHGIAFIAESMLAKLVSPITLSSNLKLVETIREIMLETSIQGVIGALQGMRDRPDSTPLLSQINVPVLIVQGTDDQLIPLSEVETMHEQISGSRLVVIPKAGHLSNMEQPDQYNQAVRDFLGSLG